MSLMPGMMSCALSPTQTRECGTKPAIYYNVWAHTAAEHSRRASRIGRSLLSASHSPAGTMQGHANQGRSARAEPTPHRRAPQRSGRRHQGHCRPNTCSGKGTHTGAPPTPASPANVTQQNRQNCIVSLHGATPRVHATALLTRAWPARRRRGLTGRPRARGAVGAELKRPPAPRPSPLSAHMPPCPWTAPASPTAQPCRCAPTARQRRIQACSKPTWHQACPRCSASPNARGSCSAACSRHVGRGHAGPAPVRAPSVGRQIGSDHRPRPAPRQSERAALPQPLRLLQLQPGWTERMAGCESSSPSALTHAARRAPTWAPTAPQRRGSAARRMPAPAALPHRPWSRHAC